MTRRAVWFVAPVLAMMLWTIAPLATGAQTLYLRDVLNTHMLLRSDLGRAVRQGELPLVDGLRAGGQPLLGNPNAVPLYPDNVLLLIASDLWQLNAHFWLHWLLALPAMYGLGRVWGLGREASWMAAVVFAFSGYFLSQLNLYNAVAGVALAPALVASLLATSRQATQRWALPAFGGLWALQILAGDPIVAMIALVSALTLTGLDGRRPPWRRVALALLAGTLVAAPQWIETLRILPGSYRGIWGASATSHTSASPSPEAAIDLLLPMFFGRPDLQTVWGSTYFGGTPPLYFSLAPGLIALAYAAVGVGKGDRRTRRIVGTLMFAATIVYSGGALGRSIAEIPGAHLFRYTVKLALPAMLILALLVGRGMERVEGEETARRGFRRALIALACCQMALVVMLLPGEGAMESLFRRIFARGLGDDDYTAMRAGWTALAIWQTITSWIAWGLIRRRAVGLRAMAGAGLLLVHAGSQLLFLRPLLATDEIEFYRRTPEVLSFVSTDAVTAHGGYQDIFGAGYFERGEYPDRRGIWRARRAFDEAFSFTLPASGRRTELNRSPEGLDSFPVVAACAAMEELSDAERVRLLAATGVERLLLPRPLEAPDEEATTLLHSGSGTPPLRVYRIERALADAQLVGNWTYAPNMNAALTRLRSKEFDPLQETVLSGDGPARLGASGDTRIVQWAADEIELAVDSVAGGALVVRRAWHSIWRAEIDGVPAPVRIANLTRLAVEVPPGLHRVRFFVPRQPFARGVLLSALGTAALVALAWRGAGGRQRADRAAGKLGA